MCDENEIEEEDRELNDDLQDIAYNQCDGCGFTGPGVYHDGYGFFICTRGTCNQYSVRGLSPSDFY